MSKAKHNGKYTVLCAFASWSQRLARVAGPPPIKTSDIVFFFQCSLPFNKCVGEFNLANSMSWVVGNGICQIILYHRNVAMTGMVYCTAPQLQPV